jgi:signal peptidase
MRLVQSNTVRRLLTVALVGAYGLIAVVAVAAFAGYRPVVLSTGSMAPAAPAGALVIAAPVEPDELAVGDLLVMNRPGGVLVTHRVVELAAGGVADGATAGGGADGAVSVVTKGDANSAVDPEPYVVAGTHLAGRWVIPGAGGLLTAMANPLGPVVLLLAVALAITLVMLTRRSPVAAETAPQSTDPGDESSQIGSMVDGAGRLAGRGLRFTTVVALLLGSLSVMRVSSLALFTDSESITGNQFNIGSVDLTVSQSSALVTYTAPPMNPGDQHTAPLTVGNAGSLDLRYAMVSTTTEDVAAAELVLTIKSGVTTCDDANWAATGTVVYTGVLGTTGGTAAIGSTAQGAQAGDRALAASTNEVLCFNVTLPVAAPNSVQGLSTTATFAFEAEQTVNN